MVLQDQERPEGRRPVLMRKASIDAALNNRAVKQSVGGARAGGGSHLLYLLEDTDQHKI